MTCYEHLRRKNISDRWLIRLARKNNLKVGYVDLHAEK